MVRKNTPKDPVLYDKVVAEAKKKFLVWPSAYASGWVVKTYKQRGGEYLSRKPRLNDTNDDDDRPLSRWYQEEWVDVCTFLKQNKIEACGRSRADWSDYRYCRPLKRITAGTPTTLDQAIEKLGKDALLARCRQKKQNPETRMKKI